MEKVMLIGQQYGREGQVNEREREGADRTL